MRSKDPVLIGTIAGLLSAVGYTAANVCLRAVSDQDPIWITANKAVPTMFMVAPWLIATWRRGQSIWPPRRVFWTLVAAALFSQVMGNVTFQYALGIVGIATTVPLVLGTMIVSGAMLGRIYLSEPITVRSMISMLVLVGAIVILSSGASGTPSEEPGVSVAWGEKLLGVVAACTAGVAYAVLGVVIRYGVTGRASIASTLFIVAGVGAVVLGAWGGYRLRWEGISAISISDYGVMLLAGIFNAVAFVALTKSLQLTSIVFVNALNATQAAMAALAGILFFSEVPTWQLGIGCGLTSLGLLLMEKAGHEPEVPPDDEISPTLAIEKDG